MAKTDILSDQSGYVLLYYYIEGIKDWNKEERRFLLVYLPHINMTSVLTLNYFIV